ATANLYTLSLHDALPISNIGKYLAIVLDGKIQSIAQISTRISGNGIIEGGAKGFAPEQAKNLVLTLRSGALPARTEYISELVVRSEEHTSELQSRGHLVC